MRSIDHIIAFLALLIADSTIFRLMVRAEGSGWIVKVDIDAPIESLQVLSMIKRGLPVSTVWQWETLQEQKDGQQVSVCNA
jgi:hypothetical protein